MWLIRQFAIRNELLYSGFVLPNVQIFFVQKISFAAFGVSIDDFFTRYAGLGYSLFRRRYNYKRRDGRTDEQTDRCTDVLTKILVRFFFLCMGVCPRLELDNIMFINCLGYDFYIYGAFEFLCSSIANL